MLSRISRKVFQQNAVSVTNSVRSGRATLVSVKEFSIAARMNHDFEIPNKYNFDSTSNSNSENKVLELDVKRYGAKKHIPVTLNSLVAPIPRDSDQAILEKVRLSIASFLHREVS